MCEKPETLRDAIRKFWATPAGQHNDPGLIIKWEWRTPPGSSSVFDAIRVPLILSSAVFGTTFNDDNAVDYLLAEALKTGPLGKVLSQDDDDTAR